MSERQSHCLFSRQSGAEVLRNNEFYQKPALSFTIQYTSPAEKKVIVSSVLQLTTTCYWNVMTHLKVIIILPLYIGVSVSMVCLTSFDVK